MTYNLQVNVNNKVYCGYKTKPRFAHFDLISDTVPARSFASLIHRLVRLQLQSPLAYIICSLPARRKLAYGSFDMTFNFFLFSPIIKIHTDSPFPAVYLKNLSSFFPLHKKIITFFLSTNKKFKTITQEVYNILGDCSGFEQLPHQTFG